MSHFNDGCLSVDSPVGNSFCRVMTAQRASLPTAIQGASEEFSKWDEVQGAQGAANETDPVDRRESGPVYRSNAATRPA